MLSVIIPAYNAEKTIERAVNSVLDSERDVEILVVENGSTDKTSEVVNRISDTKVRLLHSKKGVSRARNLGIKEAKGEWVTFLDADDIWLGYKKSDYENDVIMFNYYKDNNLVDLGFEKGQILPWALEKPTRRMTVWAKVYKRAFLIDNCLFFNDALWVGEDSEFLIRVFLQTNNIKVNATPVYKYCSDTESVMRSENPRRTRAYLESLTVAEKDILHTSSIIKNAFNDYIYAHINLIGVHDIYNSDLRERWTYRNKKIKEVLDFPIVSRAIYKLKPSDIFNIQRTASYFFKIHMYTLGGVICYIRSIYNHRRLKKNGKNTCFWYD